MRGKPVGSPINLRVRWYGDGEPEVGDIVVTEAGHAAYVVEERLSDLRQKQDHHGTYTAWRLETTKLDPDDLPQPPDWMLFPL